MRMNNTPNFSLPSTSSTIPRTPTSYDVDTSMEYEEEDSFMEQEHLSFDLDPSQPQTDVVSWQASQPASRDLWELSKRVPDRRSFKKKPTPTLLWDDFNQDSAGSSSSTIGSSRTSSGSFSRSTSFPSLPGTNEESSSSFGNHLKPQHDESRKFFAPVEATTVKLRRSVTTQHIPQFGGHGQSRSLQQQRHASLGNVHIAKQSSGDALGMAAGKGKEKEQAKAPRRSEPLPENRFQEPHRGHLGSTTRPVSGQSYTTGTITGTTEKKSTFSRTSSASSTSTAGSASTSSNTHRSNTTAPSSQGYTPDTSISMDMDVDPPPAPVKIPPPLEVKVKEERERKGKSAPGVRLHPLLMQKSSSTSTSSTSPSTTTKPRSPVLPSPIQASQSNFANVKPPPTSQSTNLNAGGRRPVLGMCRRAHTLPSSQQGTGGGAAGGGVKKFRPPLMSQVSASQGLAPSQSQPQAQPQRQIGSRGLVAAGASRLQTSKPAANTNMNVDKNAYQSRNRSPELEEVSMEADSSFGDMSFDMDALEETMKQYD